MAVGIKISRNAGGMFRAWCPALPGCYVLGRSRREARERIDRAIFGYLANVRVSLPRELGRLGRWSRHPEGD